MSAVMPDAQKDMWTFMGISVLPKTFSCLPAVNTAASSETAAIPPPIYANNGVSASPISPTMAMATPSD